MNELKNYINTIVVAMVFITFIEILMPDSSMKKYTKIVLGLLVMTIILNPVLNFLKKDFSLAGYSFKYQNQLNSIYLKKQASEYNDKQSEQISKLYRINLENQIAQTVKKEANIKNLKVDVDIVDDVKSDNFGQIKKISLVIYDGIKSVEKIEKIDIGSSREVKSQMDSSRYESLRNKLAAMYDVRKDNISINENQ